MATNTGRPTIGGITKEGDVLTASPGAWTGTQDYIDYEYQWMRCNAGGGACVDITGETQKTYQLKAADVGSRMRVRVNGKDKTNPTDPGGGTPPPPSSGDKLSWAPPTLSAPATRTLVNSSRALPTGNGGSVIVKCGERLTGGSGEWKGYNGGLVAIAGEIVSSEQNEGHIIPRENVGATVHIEGWKVQLNGAADAFTARWRTKILQLQNCYIEVTTAGTTHHSDGYQTQEAIHDELRFDKCTIKTDYQGIFLSNEPRNQGPEDSRVSHVIIKRVLFLPGAHGAPATYFFKAFPPRPTAQLIGQVDMYDVWMPAAVAPQYKVFPSASWKGWDGSNIKQGNYLINKVHPYNGKTYQFVKFSTPSDVIPTGVYSGQAAGDCGVRGDGGIWLYNSLADVPPYVGAANNPGLSYVSPGYA